MANYSVDPAAYGSPHFRVETYRRDGTPLIFAGGNILDDSSFEGGSAPLFTTGSGRVARTKTTDQAYFGSQSLAVTYASGTDPYSDFTLSSVPYRGLPVVFSAWAYIPSSLGPQVAATPNRTLLLYDGVSAVEAQVTNKPRDQWFRLVLPPLVVNASSTSLQLRLYNVYSTGAIYYDGVQLEVGSQATNWLERPTLQIDADRILTIADADKEAQVALEACRLPTGEACATRVQDPVRAVTELGGTVWPLDEPSGAPTAYAPTGPITTGSVYGAAVTRAVAGPSPSIPLAVGLPAGTGSYVQAGATLGDAFAGSEYTVMAWIYHTFATAAYQRWFQSLSGVNQLYGHIGNGTAPSINPGVSVHLGGSYAYGVATNTFPASTWTHVAVRFKASSYMSVYKNGARGQQVTAVPYTPPATAGSAVLLGASGVAGQSALQGRMAHFAVFPRALTDTEIQRIYLAGKRGP